MEHVLRIAISVGLSLINNLSTGGAHRDDLRPALRLPIIATLAIIMLLGVIPATLPQSSAHAASGYLADEIGNTEINVDVDEEFAVVLWVVDAVELAGYDCKITLSGPGTAIGEAAHGDWFADGHSVFDGLSTADYRTAMLTSPTDITGSGDVVVFTIRADEEGTIAINVDTDYFFLADTEGNKMEMTVPSTLYINVSGGDRMESSGEDTSSSRDGGEGLLDAGTFTLKVRWEDLQFGSSVEFFLWVDGVAVNDCFAPFEQEVDADSTVRLVAGDPSGYDFLRWKVDGVSQDEGDDDITFVMTKNKIAVMVFARNCTLNVKSEGKTPVLVNGGKFGEEYGEYSGYTDYEVTSIPAGTEVALSPDDDSDFYCWDIDGVLLEQQGSSIHFTINWDCTATAIFYADLTVDTQPSHVVAFDWTTNFRGMSGGGTDYTPCDYEDEKGTTQFTLELSPSYLQFEDSGITYVFHHWELGSVPQEPGKTSITFILHADSSAIAVYGRQWFVDSQGGADFTTIQAAIDDSSVHDGDTVVVNPGTYSLHGNRDIELKGKAITLTSAQNLALAQDPTIIDCGGTEQDPHRAFYVHEGELNATSIEGFIIQNGYAKGIEDFESGGGAICCQGTLPVIRNNIFRANYAAGAGGAIRCEGHESQVLGGMLIIEGNTFRDEVGENPFNGNNANRTGGAITCARYEAVLIKDNVLLGNTSETRQGGAMAIGQVESVIIQGNNIGVDEQGRVSPNEAYGCGGGIFIYWCTGTVEIQENTISHSKCHGSFEIDPELHGYACLSYGGGISLISNACPTFIQGNLVEDNIAEEDGHGGGISVYDAGDYLEISGNTFRGNVAHGGGGIRVRAYQELALLVPCILKNNLIAGNTNPSGSSGLGGGALFQDSQFDIYNCTFADNVLTTASGLSPDFGGGLTLKRGTSTYPPELVQCVVRDSIFFGNSVDEDGLGSQIAVLSSGYDTEVSMSYCDIQDGSAGVFPELPNDYIDWGDGIIGENQSDDPEFASPVDGYWSGGAWVYSDSADYHVKSSGGRYEPSSQTWVHTDTVDSPCIDAGDPQSSYEGEYFPDGGRVNLGAYGATNEASITPWLCVYRFSATDQTTGSRFCTNSATIDISMSVSAPEGETITGYQVTEFPFEEPTTWLSQAPTTYTITGGEGITRLIAWAQSEDDVTHATHVAHFVRGIYYAQTPPVVSSLTIVPKEYGKVEVCWNTDVDTEAAVEYGKVLYSWQPEGTVSPPVGLSTTHVITVDGLDPALNYKFRILNNEFESTVAYHPLPWPTPGDSNFDCRVNILDLIAIRNKLNLSAGDDDNWKYDMNRDGRINILDLIHVRNHLNTQCP